jgi:branched-chain amino acid transport system substrate-binding protein
MPNDRTSEAGRNGRTGTVGRRRFLTTVGAGAAATSLAGCLGDGGGGDSGPIQLGGVFLLSGLAEALGSASRAGAQLAVDQINEEDGGIMDREVEITFRDHANSDAVGQVTSLVQEENVVAMIGMTSSGVSLQAAPTIRDLGVPFTLTDIGTPFLTEHDTDTYGSYFDEDGTAAGIPNLFRTNANTTTNTYAIAKYAVENTDATRVANIGPDYAYGTQTWNYFKAFADALGGDFEYVQSVFPETGASDMTPQINQVQGADPDLVFTSFWAGDAVTFVQQAANQGLFDKVDDVFDTLGADPTVFSALGNTMPEGLHYSSWYWHSTFDNEANQNYVQRFKDANGGDIPSYTGPSTYSAIYLYKRAIENAGSTNPDDIISELEGMEFDGPRGSWRIDPDSHQATAPTIIGETSTDDDVPYDGVGLEPSQAVSLDQETAADLLEGTDLPPGL